MYPTDRDEFAKILNGLAVVFSKDLSKPLESAYFEALKDVPLGAVREAAVRHQRHGKFFPKPHELRPSEAAPTVKRTAQDEYAFQRGQRLAAAGLDALKREDPGLWSEEVRLRRCDRILAADPEDSPQYAAALHESRAIRDRRRAEGRL